MDRVVVVSGGGTGIGRAIARTYAGAGDHVVILGRRAEVVAATAAEINETVAPDRVRAIGVDVADSDAVAALARTLHDDYGTLERSSTTPVGRRHQVRPSPTWPPPGGRPSSRT